MPTGERTKSPTSLPEDVFDGLSNLVGLDLYGNKLTSLPENIFDGLSNLRDLSLHRTDLRSLPEDVFDGLTIPTGGSVVFTVGTTDDSTDEADGSITATVGGASGYRVSSSQGGATVSVADNGEATFEVVLSAAKGATIGDGVAVARL